MTTDIPSETEGKPSNCSPYGMAVEQIYGEVLNPSPDDDTELLARLERQKAAHRREYESRKSELTGRTDEEAVRQAATLEEIYNAPLRRLGEHGSLVAGYLNVTLEMVKEGGGIQDQYLREWWAARNAFDLREMAQDKKAFLRQWAELTSEVVDVQPTKLGGRMVARVENWAGWHDQEQQLLALVVHRIHFADGRRFWLSGCQIRDLQTPEETREFDELLKACPGSELPPVPLSRGWANEDYSVVRWPTTSGAVDESSVPLQLAAFIAELHAEKPGHRLKGAAVAERVAKRLGISAKDYRPAQVFESAVGKKLEKAGIIGRKKTGKEWLFWLNPPTL